MVNTKFEPSWKAHEKNLHSPNPEIAEKASDAFYEERNLELATSKKARDWERSRKEAAAKEKPEWVKQKRAEDQEPLNNLIKLIRKGGSFMQDLIPAPGFLLINPANHQENARSSGLIVPDEHTDTPNTAIVHRTSDYKMLPSGEKQEPFFDVGDVVLVRKGAGLEVQEKGTDLIFISYEDVLGVMK